MAQACRVLRNMCLPAKQKAQVALYMMSGPCISLQGFSNTCDSNLLPIFRRYGWMEQVSRVCPVSCHPKDANRDECEFRDRVFTYVHGGGRPSPDTTRKGAKSFWHHQTARHDLAQLRKRCLAGEQGI